MFPSPSMMTWALRPHGVRTRGKKSQMPRFLATCYGPVLRLRHGVRHKGCTAEICATHAKTAFSRASLERILSSPLEIMSVMDIGDGTFEFFFLQGGGRADGKMHKQCCFWGVFHPICLQCFLTNFCGNRPLDADPAGGCGQ